MMKNGLWVAVMLSVVVASRADAQRSDPFDTANMPQLTLTDVARVGDSSSDLDYLFDGIGDVAVLGPESFAVLDRGSNEVRAYDSAGTLLWKVGGEGDGPGEFRSASRLSLLEGDRFFVWDSGLSRATTFGSDGSVLSTARADFGAMAAFTAGFVAALPDGSWIQRIEVSPLDLRDEPDGPRRDSVTFVRVAADGASQRDVMTVQGPTRYLARYSKVTWERQRLILGRDLVAAVRGDTLLVATTDSMYFRRVVPGGGTVAPLRIDRPVRPADRRAREAERSVRVEAASGTSGSTSGESLPGLASMMAGRAEALEAMPAEESFPAFSDLLIGADGDAWIKEYRRSGEADSELWYRLDSAYEPDGWMQLPEGEELEAVGHGLVLSVATDSLGVETVIVRRLR